MANTEGIMAAAGKLTPEQAEHMAKYVHGDIRAAIRAQAIRDLEPWLKHRAYCPARHAKVTGKCSCGLQRAKEGR